MSVIMSKEEESDTCVISVQSSPVKCSINVCASLTIKHAVGLNSPALCWQNGPLFMCYGAEVEVYIKSKSLVVYHFVGDSWFSE